MDTLFHYCSTDVFLSIISNKSVWLSSLSLSNDAMEGRLVSEVISELARDDGLNQETINKTLRSIKTLEKTIDGLGFCLSEDGDFLSQWRGYADNAAGFSIGFSKEYLASLGKSYQEKKRSGFSLQQVKYDRNEQLEIVKPTYVKMKALIDQGALKTRGLRTALDLRAKEEYEADQKKTDSLFQSLSLSALMLFGDLFVLKSDAFNEEREWRLISILLKNGEDEAQYRATQYKVVPYRSFDLRALPKNSISEVILGPRNETPHHVIKGILNKYGFHDVSISNSKSTYRG